MKTELIGALAKLMNPEKPRSAVARYLVAVASPLVAATITNLFFTLSHGPFFPLFTLSIMVAAIYSGWVLGLLATAVSAAALVITMREYPSLQVQDSEGILRLITFCAVGVVSSTFIGMLSSLQKSLANEREKIRVTLTSIGDAVLATDNTGRVTFMNPIAEEITGWRAADATGKPLEAVFPIFNEITKAAVENPIRKVFELGHVVGLANHTILTRRDGTEIPIEDSAAPIRDARGTIVGAVLVFRDASERREAEAALLKTEKLASVGRLAATIAHEINNPLEAVGNLLFLVQTVDDPHDVREYAKAAERELIRASEVTKQTLAFARRENTPECVEVGELVDGILVLYSNKIRIKNIHVEQHFQPHVPAYATKSEVRQVLGNLIANALDALPQNGSLQIRVRASHCGDREVARVIVADSGHGIAAQHLPRIFEPFFTTKEHVGTGLGLWVTKQIVDAHEGCIHIRSRVGRGTVVAVCLPSVAHQPAAATAGC